jgi:hypothetical protein
VLKFKLKTDFFKTVKLFYLIYWKIEISTTVEFSKTVEFSTESEFLLYYNECCKKKLVTIFIQQKLVIFSQQKNYKITPKIYTKNSIIAENLICQ